MDIIESTSKQFYLDISLKNLKPKLKFLSWLFSTEIPEQPEIRPPPLPRLLPPYTLSESIHTELSCHRCV